MASTFTGMTIYKAIAYAGDANLGRVEIERTDLNGKIPPWHGYANFLDIGNDDARLVRGVMLTLDENGSTCSAIVASSQNGIVQLTVYRVDR